ncbi:MAG: hypothetical protein ACOC5B_02470 [Myxococcota bacterium]
MSLNTEYLIHFGAASEMVERWGWEPSEVIVERGEYDALGEVDGRVAVAMEAKARIEGPTA